MITTTQGPKIVVRLIHTKYQSQWQCDVCGGYTLRSPVEAVAPCDCGEPHCAHHEFQVCEFCLEQQSADPSHIDRKLGEYAESLDSLAARKRAVIGRVVVPTFAEYVQATQRANAALLAGRYPPERS